MNSNPRHLPLRVILMVISAHCVFLLLLLIVPWVRRALRPSPPEIIPVELAMFTHVPPPSRDPVPAVARQEEPLPEVEPDTPPVRTEQPRRERPKIEVSQEWVERRRDPAPDRRPEADAEQIRKMLEENLRRRTTATGQDIPADARDLELIRRTLHQAWRQPSGHHLSGRVTEVSLRLTEDGSIVDYDIVSSSGDAAMDASVRAAMNAVRRIPGLSPGFTARRSRVTVYFELAE